MQHVTVSGTQKVGDNVGTVGLAVVAGAFVGAWEVGSLVGNAVGANDVGNRVGDCEVGSREGKFEGEPVGGVGAWDVGNNVGCTVGPEVGGPQYVELINFRTLYHKLIGTFCRG